MCLQHRIKLLSDIFALNNARDQFQADLTSCYIPLLHKHKVLLSIESFPNMTHVQGISFHALAIFELIGTVVCVHRGVKETLHAWWACTTHWQINKKISSTSCIWFTCVQSFKSGKMWWLIWNLSHLCLARCRLKTSYAVCNLPSF